MLKFEQFPPVHQKTIDSAPPPPENSSYHRGIFFSGIPPDKIRAKNFSGPRKLKFLDFYRTCSNLEGARRVPFKAFIHIFADMGSICVEGHKDPRSVPAAVQRPTLASYRQEGVPK